MSEFDVALTWVLILGVYVVLVYFATKGD